MTIGVMVAAGTLLLAGCQETAKNQIHAQPPAPTPVPGPEYLHQSLPLTSQPVFWASLVYDTRPAIDVLVEKVRADLTLGQKEYKAGDFDKAHADFDRALNLILASGFQADFDPRLSDLFDQIGELIQSYDSNAAKGSEEEGEAPSEPAAIDEIADMTLPRGDPRLALKAQNELIAVPHDLPLAVNDSVLQYLSFFTTTRGRAIVERGLTRAGRYNDMIRRVLKQEGLPQDLMYLAQAESAFQPQAVSRAGARGIWQFMPFRGQEYDLERTYWVDERSDPEKATRAAAHHMRDLYEMFGDWYLVMAAYNSGPLNVVKAVERTGYADFWELQKRNALPKQTQNYVPIIIALALVAKDPALYGIHVAPEKPAPVDTVRPGHQIDLHLVADATGADLDDLRLLNPELLRNVTPNDPQFQLKLPLGLGQKFEATIHRVPEDKWTSWRLHAIETNETISEIAQHYRVTVTAIRAANHLEADSTVLAGFLLNIPTAPPAVRLVRYRVLRGDTLEGIAERFDVTVSELKRWNHIKGNLAPRGARLRIYAGGQINEAPPSKSRSAHASGSAIQSVSERSPDKPVTLQHRVKRGETLYEIAREYGTTVSALRQSNPFLADRDLEAGDLLSIQR